MELAAKDGFALQLHVEGELESTYADMAALADKAGLAKDRLVRHYSPPNVKSEITQGLTPSVLIGKGALETLMDTAGSSSHGFLLETDYMDDLRRPGAVLGPKTVPKRTQQLVVAGIDEELMWKAHVDLPNRLYGEE
jgi:TatD-related deoxyribonuclease